MSVKPTSCAITAQVEEVVFAKIETTTLAGCFLLIS